MMPSKDGKKSGTEHAAWLDRIEKPIPGVPLDSMFAQQLRFYALAGNLEKKGKENAEILRRKRKKDGQPVDSSGELTLVDLFEKLLHNSRREPQHVQMESADEEQFAEQGSSVDGPANDVGGEGGGRSMAI